MMPKLVSLFGFLTILLFFTQCGERGRTNPFDPTRSQVENVLEMELQSEEAQIVIRWDRWQGPDIQGYNIYRAEIPGELALLAQVDASANSYTDTSGIIIGNKYVYGITARSENDETYITTRDTIATGTTRWWVLSHDFSPVSVLSHDGLHRNESFGRFLAPRLIAAPEGAAYVYIYDSAGGRIFRQYRDNETDLILDEIRTVREMYYNQNINTLYVARDEYQTESGFSVFIQSLPNRQYYGYNFADEITEVEFTSAGSIWMSHADTLTVIPSFGNSDRTYITVGESRTINTFEAYHSGSTLLLFLGLSDNSISIYSGSQFQSEISGTGSAELLKYNESDGSLWILGKEQSSDQYSVYRHLNGVTTKMLSGLEQVIDMEVNPVTNQLLVADYAAKIMYLISTDGNIRSKSDVAGRVHEIEVQVSR